MTFLDIALDCLKLGWSVFPCVPADKNPIKGVPGYIAGSNSEDQVRAWWAREPNANPAIATGKSRVDVLDIDKGLTDEASLRAFMAARNLPETYAVRTGSRPAFKVQLYYAHDGDTIKSFNGWEDGTYGGDVRGSMWGHVMAAGAVHPDSKERYEVLWDLPLASVPKYVRNLKRAEKASQALADPTAPIVEWRNDTLYRVLCKHRANGADDEMLRDFALRAQARMPNPLDEEELEIVITNACKQPIGLPEPVALLGGRAEVSDAEDADDLQEGTRPKYPDEVWNGTPYGEFADSCTADNFISKKFFIEAIRTVTGSIVGDRLFSPVEGCKPRAYTILITEQGGGKGTACERVTQLYRAKWDSGMVSVEPPLIFGAKELFWRSSSIGAQIVNVASAPGLMKALEYRKLRKNEARDPREIWKPLHRFIGIQEEMRGLFANFANESTGAGLESVLCELWDRETFTATATKDRGPEYGEVMYGLLGGITPQGWEAVFSKVASTQSGFLSRLNIIGSENERRTSDMTVPDFDPLRRRFFPLIKDLIDHPRVIPTSLDAKAIIKRWFDALVLPQGVTRSRLNVQAWRTALHLAWLRGHDYMTAADAEAGTRVADYQVAMREYYAPAEGETRQARCEAAIRKVMVAKRRTPYGELNRRTHGSRFGVGMFERAVLDLCKAGELRIQKADTPSGRPWTVILLKQKD